MKTIRTAVMIVGAVALVATGVGAVMGGAAFLAATGVALSTVSAISAVASAGGMLLSLTAKKPKMQSSGSTTAFQFDPQAGIPYMMGRTFYAGSPVKRETWGTDNQYQGFTTVYSYGPIQSIEAFQADRSTITFNGGTYEAIGSFATFMWFVAQLGLCPEAAALAQPVAGYPGWTASSKLSGLAASNWVLKFDKKGKKFTSGPPSPGIIAQGVKVYDPRLDSTYPGGSGACRAFQENTYVYSNRPALHGLTYAMGRYQNSKKRFGIGFGIDAIDVQAFVNAANIEDANNWTVGGVMYSQDDKWNRLKQIGQSGCWEPIKLGGRLSLIQSAPRVSIATINSSDVVGKISLVATQSQRERINGLVPRYRSEAHGWQVIPARVVRVGAYVTADGGERTEEMDMEFVQDLQQASTLAAYDIVNRREFGPIEMGVKLRWIGLKPGDCVTLNIPEANLNNQKCIVISRSLDPENGAVNLQFKSETDSKHAFALGVPGAAPPFPALTPPDQSTVAAPAGGSWTMTTVQLTTVGNGSIPVLRFAGSVTNSAAEAVIFDYRETGTTEWIGTVVYEANVTKADIATIKPGATYDGSIRYVVRGVPGNRLIFTAGGLGPVVSAPPAWSTVVNDGAKPDDLATRNEDGDNMIPNPISLDQASFANGAVMSIVPGATGRNADRYRAQLFGANFSTAYWCFPLAITCVAGEVLYYRYTAKHDGTNVDAVRGGYTTYGADGNAINSYDVPDAVFAGTEPANTWQTRVGKITVPAGAAWIRPYIIRPAYTAGYSFFVGEPYLGRGQPGATLGAPSGTPAGSYSDVDALVSVAATASSTATSANNFANDVADNNKFSKDEKKRYINTVNNWVTSIPALVAQGRAAGLQSLSDTLDSTWSTFYSYLLSVGYNNTSTSTSITRSTFLANERAFSDSLTALANAADRGGNRPGMNALFNGSFALGTKEVNIGSFVLTDDFRGVTVEHPYGIGGEFVMSFARPVNCSPGATMVLSATGNGSPSINQPTFVDVEWRNGGNNALLGYSSTSNNACLFVNGSFSLARKAAVITPPAATDGSGFVKATVRIVANSDVAYAPGTIQISQVKLEYGTQATAFSDEATDGAELGSSTGRLTNGATSLPSNWSFGIRGINGSGFTVSQTNAGSSVTLNIGAATWQMDTGATITYPSGTIGGLAYSTTYYLWRVDPNLDGGSSFGVSTNIYDAGLVGRVYYGYFTTMNSGGTGGGGGGGGRPNCPERSQWVMTDDGAKPAFMLEDIQYPIKLRTLAEGGEALGWEAFQSATKEENICVRVTTENGASLICAQNTPIVNRAGMWGSAINCWMGQVPTMIDGQLQWSKVDSITVVGIRDVAKITAHSSIYAAGEHPNRMILTHNAEEKQ